MKKLLCLLTGICVVSLSSDFLNASTKGSPVKTEKPVAKKSESKTKNSKKIVIPADAEEIEDEAYMNDVNITAVTFAKNSKVEEIGRHAFFGCKNLKSIILPNCLKEIERGAFQQSGIKKVKMPDTTKVEIDAFAQTGSPVTIVIDGESFEKAQKMWTKAFGGTDKTGKSCIDEKSVGSKIVYTDKVLTLTNHDPITWEEGATAKSKKKK